MQQTYTVDIAGRKETLPVLDIGGGVGIAFFNLHGNADLTEYCAEKLTERIKASGVRPEVFITAESKGLQLTHCVARNYGAPNYAVARKSKKLYMQDGISVSVNTITTENEQKLYLSERDVKLLRGKRVCIVDDVVSTGGSLGALKKLVELAGGNTVLCAAVLSEDDADARFDFISLGSIPLFK